MPEAFASHPDADQLSAFALGMLSRETSAVVAEHLASCVACQEQLDRQQPDSFVSKIVEAGKGIVPSEELTVAPAKRALPEDVPSQLVSSSKYEVVGKLGQGGMGTVWKAKHAFLDCLVAIKVASPEAMAHADSRARFLQEMKAAGKLRHERIVSFFDADQVGDLLLLVMEYVEGVSLERLVRQKGPLPIGFACLAVSQAAEGLQHAHDQGMVHRDIKPANLVVTKETREVKVLDFGLARLTQDQANKLHQTQDQTFMGTPDYVAPEQANDARTADVRSDVYSLGCTFYFLLAGQPPFRRETVMDTLLAHAQDPPQPLPTLRPDVPESLWAVVAKMLAKRPEDRFQTPGEVALALEPFVGAFQKAAKVEGGAPPANATDTRTPMPVDTDEVETYSGPPPVPEKVVVSGQAGIRWLPYTVAAVVCLVGPTLIVLAALKFAGRGRSIDAEKPALPSGASTTKPDAPIPDAEGFVPLFNGKDLTGWKTYDPNDSWKVDANGLLVGSGTPRFLFTRRDDYRNFHFRVEARIDRGDSGQFFRVPFAPGNPGGYEAQINCNPQTPARAGTLFLGRERFFPQTAGPKAGEWFTQEVILIDNHLVVTVNGRITVDVWLYGMSAAHTRGHLALQLNKDTEVAFRKVAVKELGDATAAAKDPRLGFFESAPRKFFVKSAWAMGREFDGVPSPISPRVVLGEKGFIQGATHANETRWEISGSALVFRHKAGRVTTVFDKVTFRNGKMVFLGKHQDSRTVHELTRLP